MTEKRIEYINRFGRRPGRGLRPWLLIPKLLAVAVYLGSLATLAYLWQTTPPGGHRLWLIDATRRIALFVMVPSLLCAIALGIALFFQHPREFARMRWLRLKVLVLAALIPSAHLFVSSRLDRLRHAADGDATQLVAGLWATLAVSVVIVAMARLKPRIGAESRQRTEPRT